ncbi:PucR C-terminal helix-turn-helix domain-containing protein [Micrococcales bacterium KH10]|nr:PucR C-terminal helix-turn-helix domain-containing protein [Micrococcales bacterium KH10]
MTTEVRSTTIRATSPSPLGQIESSPANLQRLRDAIGPLTTAAMRRLDKDLPWYRSLSAEDRSYVGLVTQSGINSFVNWYNDPSQPPSDVGEMFAAAPPELTRSISLQHTLHIVRYIVEVVEAHAGQIAEPGTERDLREAVLRYSREVAFSAAEVYARTAEARGAWDARLEALVVDAIVRGDTNDSVQSRAAALGWTGQGQVLVVIATTDDSLDELRTAELRRAARRAARDALVSIQGSRAVIVLGGEGDLVAAAHQLLSRLGPGPVVIGPTAADLEDATRSAQAAIRGMEATPAWSHAPRPVLADDLLPERVLIGDPLARATLIASAYQPLREAGGTVLETLRAYLGTGRSLEGAARDLYVHPNTVRYRLRKVCEITGWDPLEPRESFVLHVALAVGELDSARTSFVEKRQSTR